MPKLQTLAHDTPVVEEAEAYYMRTKLARFWINAHNWYSSKNQLRLPQHDPEIHRHRPSRCDLEWRRLNNSHSNPIQQSANPLPILNPPKIKAFSKLWNPMYIQYSNDYYSAFKWLLSKHGYCILRTCKFEILQTITFNVLHSTSDNYSDFKCILSSHTSNLQVQYIANHDIRCSSLNIEMIILSSNGYSLSIDSCILRTCRFNP